MEELDRDTAAQADVFGDVRVGGGPYAEGASQAVTVSEDAPHRIGDARRRHVRQATAAPLRPRGYRAALGSLSAPARKQPGQKEKAATTAPRQGPPIRHGLRDDQAVVAAFSFAYVV